MKKENKKSMEFMKSMTFMVAEDLYKRLRILAIIKALPIGVIMSEIIEEYLKIEDEIQM